MDSDPMRSKESVNKRKTRKPRRRNSKITKIEAVDSTISSLPAKDELERGVGKHSQSHTNSLQSTLSSNPLPHKKNSSHGSTTIRLGRKRKLLNESAAEAGCSAADSPLPEDGSDDRNDDRKKKNRCAVCRKKVGLTGFECRCGGLFCSVHRYSDKHECAFDYRELGAQEIRRNNPVVVSQKIHKI